MHDLCPACLVGRMHEITTTYVDVYEGTLIHMPNVRAWRCDVCRETLFDDHAIRQIEALIGVSGPPPNHFAPDGDAARSVEPPATPDDAADSRPSPSK